MMPRTISPPAIDQIAAPIPKMVSPEAAIMKVTAAGIRECSAGFFHAPATEPLKVPTKARPAKVLKTSDGAAEMTKTTTLHSKPKTRYVLPLHIALRQRRRCFTPDSEPADNAAEIAARLIVSPPKSAATELIKPVETIARFHGSL